TGPDTALWDRTIMTKWSSSIFRSAKSVTAGYYIDWQGPLTTMRPCMRAWTTPALTRSMGGNLIRPSSGGTLISAAGACDPPAHATLTSVIVSNGCLQFMPVNVRDLLRWHR